MKPSRILLALVALVGLSGMVANNLLLKQEYDTINWGRPYPTFRRQALPNTIRHVVIETFPSASVVIEAGDTAQTLVKPDLAIHFKTRRRADTLFVRFMPPGELSPTEFDPRNTQYSPWKGVGLVLRLSQLQSLYATDSRLTVSKFRPETLAITLNHSRLEAMTLSTVGSCRLAVNRGSWAQLGAGQFGALAVSVQDSSLLQLLGTTAGVFTKNIAPSASIHLTGGALGLLK
jgi:hypothetical protein